MTKYLPYLTFFSSTEIVKNLKSLERGGFTREQQLK
jgi:hypothetical protein